MLFVLHEWHQWTNDLCSVQATAWSIQLVSYGWSSVGGPLWVGLFHHLTSECNEGKSVKWRWNLELKIGRIIQSRMRYPVSYRFSHINHYLFLAQEICLFVCCRPGWFVGIRHLMSSWDWKNFSKGAPLRSLVLPELCTRQHMWSAREESLEILRHGRGLNPGYSELSHWAIRRLDFGN